VPAAAADEAVFDSEFLSKLEQLHLLSKRLFRGHQRAERRSHHLGSSLEFADFRNYTHGDDLRGIDWNIYARLDRLFVKLFEEERDLHIYFLVDVSRSMRWAGGVGALTKLNQARRIAASLAYIGLANLDRVNVFWFDDGLVGDMGMARGKSQFHKVLEFLRDVPESAAATSLEAGVRAFVRRVKRRGLVFVLSDLFDARGHESALGELRYNQFEAHVIHITDPAEENPALSGDVRLLDIEPGAPLDVTADASLLRRYREEFARFTEGLEKFCVERGIGCARATTAVPFEDLVLRVLRDGRMVK
jgi:uncharacterized protein (DUF58 family)